MAGTVRNTIMREYRRQGDALLRARVERARKESATMIPLLEEGDTGDVCGRVMRTHQIGTAVLIAEKRSRPTRVPSRSAAVNLSRLADCEVRSMEED